MRAYWLKSVAIIGFVLGTSSVWAQENSGDRQRLPEGIQPGRPAGQNSSNRASEPEQSSVPRKVPRTGAGGSVQTEQPMTPTGERQTQTEPAPRQQGEMLKRQPKTGEHQIQQNGAGETQQKGRLETQGNGHGERRKPIDKADTQSETTTSTHRTMQRGEIEGGGNDQRRPHTRGIDPRDSREGRAEPGQEPVGLGRIDRQQQSRLRERIRRDHFEPDSDTTFSLNIGDPIPEGVHFRPLPPDLVAIVPDYQGYDYVYIEDKLVIIEPQSRRVVDVIDEGTGDAGPRFSLSPEQKREIHSEIIDRYTGDLSSNFQIRVGERVPDAIRLEPVPEDVYGDIPDIEPYRYFVIGHEVVIVEPRSREIVDVID